MNGKVKWYNKMKGFGFITGEDNQDYFVHSSEISGTIEEEATLHLNQLKTKKVCKPRKSRRFS